MQVQVRSFSARQAWPQPVLKVKFGEAEQAGLPDLSLVGTQTAFSISFPIRDSVLRAVQSGSPISANFDGNVIAFPQAPMEMRSEFSEKCAALVPKELRSE